MALDKPMAKVKNKWILEFRYRKVDGTKILLIDQLNLSLIEWALDFIDTVHEWEKKLVTKKILDKLGSFCNNAITEIWILVSVYYIFYKRSDFLNYVTKLLEKNKFLCNHIENISN